MAPGLTEPPIEHPEKYPEMLAQLREEVREEIKVQIDQVRQDFRSHFASLETAHANMRRWVLTTLTTLVLMVASAGIAVGVNGLDLFS